MTSDPIIDALIDEVPVFGASSPRASPWRWIAEGTVGPPIIPFETRSRLGLPRCGQKMARFGRLGHLKLIFVVRKLTNFVSLLPVQVQMR